MHVHVCTVHRPTWYDVRDGRSGCTVDYKVHNDSFLIVSGAVCSGLAITYLCLTQCEKFNLVRNMFTA